MGGEGLLDGLGHDGGSAQDEHLPRFHPGQLVKLGVPVVYVATGLNFPDALAGGAAGALYEGPVLLVAGSSIPKATQDELTRLKPKSIVVLGGTAVVPKKVQDDLKAYLP